MKNASHYNPAVILTVIRIALTPVIVGTIFSASWSWALGLFCLAAVTDWLDGLVARAYNCETALGAVLDPLADKVLILLVCTSVWSILPRVMPGWFVLTLWVKEFVLMFGFAFVYIWQNGYHALPSYLGKAAMVLEVVLICAVLLSLAYPRPCTWVYRYTELFMGLIVGVTVRAGYDYMARVRKDYGW